MESLAYSASKQVDPSQLENFHEFLRGYTDIFSKNVLSTNDETYKKLKHLIRKSNIVILRGDKDSSMVIMNRSDYIEKLEGMIEEGVKKGTYKKQKIQTYKIWKNFTIFCIGISIHTNIINLCIHIVISLQNYTEQPKLTNLTTFRKLTKKN